MAHVVIGLSGGVDSSVAAYLLKRQGHDVTGLFMINWHDTTGTLEGDCPWHDDRVFAELVAKRLDIPLRIVDLSADYRTRVVDYMFAEYEKGRTPNPDVLCNREIKFDVFLREAPRWARTSSPRATTAARPKSSFPTDGRSSLLAGADPNKDQSYFLCQLSQEQLRYALFPIGDLLKPEVRRIAAKQGLATAKRKDSQGICFVGKVDLPAFLQQKLASKRATSTRSSLVAEIRPGFGRSPGQSRKRRWPRYVRRPDEQHAFDRKPRYTCCSGCRSRPNRRRTFDRTPYRPRRPVALHRTRRQEDRRAQRCAFLHHRPAQGAGHRRPPGVALHPCDRHRAERHLRRRGRRPSRFVASGAAHRLPAKSTGSIPHAPSRPDRAPASASASATASPLQDATLFMRDQGAYILFDQPQRGITPGQFAAWYDGDELVGSGVISE